MTENGAMTLRGIASFDCWPRLCQAIVWPVAMPFSDNVEQDGGVPPDVHAPVSDSACEFG